MRTVRDEAGTPLLLLEQSNESSLVRDPETGERRHVPNEELEPVDEPPLVTASRTIPESVRRVVTAVHDGRSLGLLLTIEDRSPVAVRTLLDVTDYCESDLHGLLAEFRAAGLIAETDAGGRRGYETTDAAETALDALCGDD